MHFDEPVVQQISLADSQQANPWSDWKSVCATIIPSPQYSKPSEIWWAHLTPKQKYLVSKLWNITIHRNGPQFEDSWDKGHQWCFLLALSFRDVLRRMPRTYSLEQRDAPTGHLRCFPWVGPVALEPWRLELGHVLRRETMSRRCTTATRVHVPF